MTTHLAKFAAAILALADQYAPVEDQDAVISPSHLRTAVYAHFDDASCFRREFCGYPDSNAEGKYWRCSQCGSEEYVEAT